VLLQNSGAVRLQHGAAARADLRGLVRLWNGSGLRTSSSENDSQTERELIHSSSYVE
jgi:hypothetical protein